MTGDLPELGVDERDQIVESLLISATPTDKKLCNLPIRGVASHRVRRSARGRRIRGENNPIPRHCQSANTSEVRIRQAVSSHLRFSNKCCNYYLPNTFSHG